MQPSQDEDATMEFLSTNMKNMGVRSKSSQMRQLSRTAQSSSFYGSAAPAAFPIKAKATDLDDDEDVNDNEEKNELKIIDKDSNGDVNSVTQVNKDDLNKFDYGLSGGIGFDVNNFGLGIRYNYGLQTVGKERTYLGTTTTFPDAKNSSLSIYAAFKF